MLKILRRGIRKLIVVTKKLSWQFFFVKFQWYFAKFLFNYYTLYLATKSLYPGSNEISFAQNLQFFFFLIARSLPPKEKKRETKKNRQKEETIFSKITVQRPYSKFSRFSQSSNNLQRTKTPRKQTYPILIPRPSNEHPSPLAFEASDFPVIDATPPFVFLPAAGARFPFPPSSLAPLEG